MRPEPVHPGPRPSRRRTGLRQAAAIGASILIHGLLLIGFASRVMFPDVQTSPSIMVSPVLPDEWDVEQDRKKPASAQARIGPTASEHRALLQAVPTPATPTVALPLADLPDLDLPTRLLPGMEDPKVRLQTARESLAQLEPGRPKRSAFAGTVYLFDRAKRVRSGNDWFVGRGKEEADEKLYTYSLWVPGRKDDRVKHPFIDRKQWIGVDYETTVFWPQTLSGICAFRLTSDAGAIFQIDGVDVIDNDGSHGFRPRETVIEISPGPHHLRLAYLQGPKSHLGLLLHYRNPRTGGWRLFDLREILRENLKHVEHPLQDGADTAFLP